MRPASTPRLWLDSRRADTPRPHKNARFGLAWMRVAELASWPKPLVQFGARGITVAPSGAVSFPLDFSAAKCWS